MVRFAAFMYNLYYDEPKTAWPFFDWMRSSQRSVHTAGTTPQFLELFSRKIASVSAKSIWPSGSCRKITCSLGSSHSFRWSLEIPVMLCIIYIASQLLLQKKLKRCPNSDVTGKQWLSFYFRGCYYCQDSVCISVKHRTAWLELRTAFIPLCC